MPQTLFNNLLHLLRRTGKVYAGAEVSDGALLERYLAGRDEAAFAALLERHGPMVLGVCRRILGDAQAEDAFQATFLVLARRAAAIRNQASLASWLFGVARRIASKAKAQAAARRERERRVVTMARAEPIDELTWNELRSILDEEIDRLPEKLRAAIVLCHLEGKSYDQAAQELGCPKSTLASRMSKAHELLRGQLTRRGVALSAGALAAALAEKATAAPLAVPLVINATKAAGLVAAGKSIGDIVSAQALTLAEEAMKSMIGIKTKLALLVATLCVVVGAGYAGYGAWLGTPPREINPPPLVQGGPAKNDAPGDPLPAGAIVRLGEDRWLHDIPVRFAAFLPDGKSVVTVSIDYAIRVWEFPSGKEIRRMRTLASEKPEGGTTRVHAALSKDGKIIASCNRSDREIYLHDISAGKRLPGLIAKGVTALAFSPDGTRLASMETGRDASSTVRIFDWVNGKEVRRFAVPGGSDTYGVSLAYAPDGKMLATACVVFKEKKTWGEIKLWDPAKGAEIRTLGDAIDGPISLSLAFSPDGKTLAFITGGIATVAETATGKPIRKLTKQPGKTWWAVAYDGSKLYLSAKEEWDVASGNLLRRSTRTSDGSGSQLSRLLSLSPDGKTLLALGPGPPFFDLSGKDIAFLNYRRLPMMHVQWTATGKTLLTHSGAHRSQVHHTVETWEAVTGKQLKRLGMVDVPGFSTHIAISSDGNVVAGARDSGTSKVPSKLLLLETASGKELGQFPVPGSGGAIKRMVFSPDGKTLAIGQSNILGNKIALYEVPAGKLRHAIAMDYRTLIFSPDSKTLATRADALNMGLWDTTTGERIGSLPLPQGSKRIFFPPGQFGAVSFMDSAAFSPDGRSLVLDMDDGTAVLQELATAQPRRTFGEKQGQPKNVPKLDYHLIPDEYKSGACFAFSPDGTLLARGGFDRIVRLYHVQSSRQLAAFKGHAEAVTSVAFAPDGKTLASSSLDSTALIWDVTKVKRPVRPIKALQPGDLDKLWQTLAESDAAKAFAAISDFAADPKNTIAFIKDNLKPAQVAEPNAKTRGLLLQGDELRAFRAVEVLERIGTPEARQLLQTLAAGAPGALLTTSAQAALKR